MVEYQPLTAELTADDVCFFFFFFNWKTSAVSTTVCWMVETQHWKLRGTSDTLNSYKICFLWTKRTIWLLVLSFTQNIVRACSMFYPYEGYRLPVGLWLPWMLPASAGRFPITILCTDTINKKLKNVSCEYDRLLNGWNSTLKAAWYIRHVELV